MIMAWCRFWKRHCKGEYDLEKSDGGKGNQGFQVMACTMKRGEARF